MSRGPDRFGLARRVADAVLYEGYVLYPYRASAPKNRVRFQFGVVAPRDAAHVAGADPASMQTEVLVRPGPDARLTLRLRFLQAQARTVERAAGAGRFEPVERLDVDGRTLVPWDEGVECEVELADVPVIRLLATPERLPVACGAACTVEDAGGVGRVVRRRSAIRARAEISATDVGGAVKVRVRIDNETPGAWTADAGRDAVLRQSLVGAHLLLAVADGEFASLLDPPGWAAAAAAQCAQDRLWPVLVGADDARDVMLASPIILYDYPAIAPESAGDFFDATEIDELLTLRVMTLTDAEKREACATDPRARRIVERADATSPEALGLMHGAIRDRHVEPAGAAAATFAELFDVRPTAADWIVIGAARVTRGSAVRLRPRRRADAMDMFLAGRAGHVAGIVRDVEDRTYLAVTVDDDPGADLQGSVGRFFYFSPDEVEPLDAADTGRAGHGGVTWDGGG